MRITLKGLELIYYCIWFYHSVGYLNFVNSSLFLHNLLRPCLWCDNDITYTNSVKITNDGVWGHFYVARFHLHDVEWNCRNGSSLSPHQSNTSKDDTWWGIRDCITALLLRSYHCKPFIHIEGGADRSLAQPGRKLTTATKLGIYSACSPQSSIHFLSCCSNFCKPLKIQKVVRPTSSLWQQYPLCRIKLRPFSCFFSPGNRRQSNRAKSGE
jgi:hypothetical protein